MECGMRGFPKLEAILYRKIIIDSDLIMISCAMLHRKHSVKRAQQNMTNVASDPQGAVFEDLFWDVFSSGPILDEIGRYLEIADIVNLSKTCKSLSGLYNEVSRLQWDIDSLLKRFLKYSKHFRQQLGLTEALITGSFALEFFERPLWRAPNLDLVVQEGERAFRLLEYFTRYEDYIWDKEPEPDTVPHGFRYVDKVSQTCHHPFLHVYHLNSAREMLTAQICILRQAQNPAITINIYMISAYSFPVKSVIEGAWTTSLMNFISYRMAYSFFPRSTFLDRTSYMLENLGRNMDLPISKYRDRGYVFEVLESATKDRKRNHPMQNCRKAGDKFAWRIPLDVRGIEGVHRDADPVPEDEVVYLTPVPTKLERRTLGLLGFSEAVRKREEDGKGIEKVDSGVGMVEERVNWEVEGAKVETTFHYESELLMICFCEAYELGFA